MTRAASKPHPLSIINVPFAWCLPIPLTLIRVFLYQQNSLRDALVAGLHFNIFNNYAERVFGQHCPDHQRASSVILTEGSKMILTPTYHVFDLYKVHQDAVKLPVYVESEASGGLPTVSASV